MRAGGLVLRDREALRFEGTFYIYMPSDELYGAGVHPFVSGNALDGGVFQFFAGRKLER